jgi:hypothetical protein
MCNPERRAREVETSIGDQEYCYLWARLVSRPPFAGEGPGIAAAGCCIDYHGGTWYLPALPYKSVTSKYFLDGLLIVNRGTKRSRVHSPRTIHDGPRFRLSLHPQLQRCRSPGRPLSHQRAQLGLECWDVS